MSSMDCPNCGCSRYPDPGGHCPDCNYPPLQRLKLTGDKGSLSFGVLTRVGSALLLRLSSEAQFAEREEQFLISCNNSDWFIVPSPSARNQTLLNGAILTAANCLKEGDMIALGSRADSTRQVMLLQVGMVNA